MIRRQVLLSRRAGAATTTTGRYALGVLAVTLIVGVSACSNSGGSGGSGGSGATVPEVLVPLLTVPAPGLPTDIPVSPPSCGGTTPTSLAVASSVADLMSACGGTTANGDYVDLFTNLSAAVLDLYPGPDVIQTRVVPPPTSLGLIPFTWDDAEIYAQTAAEQQLRPPPGAQLVPIGGAIYVTASTPVQSLVKVDPDATAESRAGQLFIDYVVDNLEKAIPSGSVVSYTESVIGCVNAGYNLWASIDQDQSDGTATTIDNALTTYQACQDLQDKLKSDPASDLHAAAATGSIDSAELDPDLSKVADAAGQDGWVSTAEGLLKDGDDIAEVFH
jgi:hypothetical protein